MLTSDLRPPATGVSSVPEDQTGRPRRVATGGISFRKTFSALKHRNFRLFFTGQLISFSGTWMTTTAQGWLVYQLTGSKALLGIVAAAASAPMLIFATWRVACRPLPETLSHRLHPDQFDDPVARDGCPRLDESRAAMADH